MNRFEDSLTLTEMGLNWRMWKLEHPFIYQRSSGNEIVVPQNFMTDGASVPRLFWDLLPAWGTYSRAAVVHDYLCWRLNINDPHKEATNRLAADLIFWEAMGVCGTSLPVKVILFIGVRIGATHLLPGPNPVDLANSPDLLG